MGMVMSCGSNSTKQQADKPIVGGDRDEHGCIASAGYSWSELLKDCIRPFEKGMRLNPSDENSSLAAYLVFTKSPATDHPDSGFASDRHSGRIQPHCSHGIGSRNTFW